MPIETRKAALRRPGNEASLDQLSHRSAALANGVEREPLELLAFQWITRQTLCHRGGRYACGGRPVGHQREELIGAETPSSNESHQFLRGGNRHVVADGAGADIEHAAE